MLKNKKKLLITIALLLVATMGVSIAAYTIAGIGNNDSAGKQEDIAQRGASLDGNLGFMEYSSNIDLIIEDSNTQTDYMYNIVNIVPSNLTGTRPIVTYSVTDANFKRLVIDAHSEKNGSMKAGTVRVITLPINANIEASTPASQATGASFPDDYSVASLLGEADLVYIESPSETSYTGSYAMTDSIYSYLHNNYTGTDHKPIILDKLSGGGTVIDKKTTYRTLINQIYDRYLYSPVFGWDKAQSEEDFFAGRGSSHYFAKVIPEGQKASGKVLVLTGAVSGDDWIAGKFAKKENRSSIYYGRERDYPDDFDIDVLDVSTLIDPSLLEGYEFIIIENSATTVEINSANQAVYDALINMANGTQYIIYDSSNVDPADTSGGNGGNKYKELLDNLVTAEGAAKYSYVLPVNNGFFEADASTTGGADAIADIINGSNYRGSENNGRNGKKFRVLEVQPCYPIDLELAKTKSDMTGNAIATSMGLKGNYYTNPSDVLMNTSVDEANGAEYYAFEITPAKIARATGLSINQIQVDQLSTEAFISKKDVVLDTYDLVYIGGNTSALTPRSLYADYGGNYTSVKEYIVYSQHKYIPMFNMYTHTGIASHLQGYGSNSGSGMSGDPYGTIQNAQNIPTSVLLNGNDLTTIKLKELKDYIDAGMPIIFSEDVSQAFEQVYDKARFEKLGAKDIDPDSNMFKLLDYAYWKQNPSGYKGVDSTLGENVDNTAASVPNIVWNMDISKYERNGNQDDYNRNENKIYGSKAGEYVTVFNKNTAEQIVNVIQAAATRPSLVVSSCPKDYSRGDAQTYNTKKDGQMVIKANVIANTADAANGEVKCKLVLYVDQDGDGTFDEDEIVDGGTNSLKTVTCKASDGGKSESIELVYEFPQDDFFGLVSWKLVASVNDTNITYAQPCDVKSGFAYYKREDEVEKKDVRALQIMPVNKAPEGFTAGTQDNHTLYMCTECQLAAHKAKYNIINESPANLHKNTTGTKKSHAKIENIGLHEHKFGIVKYDTNGQKIDVADVNGADDWDSNFADELVEDYNFDLDILLVDEFHEYSKIIEANTLSDGTTLTTMDNPNGIDRKDEKGQAITPILDASGNAITWVEYYQAKADMFYDEWQKALGALENSSCIGNMEAFLEDLKTEVGAGKVGPIGAGIVDAEQIQQWIDHEAYYNYFIYYTGYYNFDNTYKSYYDNWVALHDKVVEYHNLYKEYSCYANTKDKWLGANYSMVVLGFAEDFGGKDLTVEECNEIKKYVNDGGSLLTTHDSTTRYQNAGSVNITNELRSVFGIDRFHATLDLQNDKPVTVSDRTNRTVYLKDPDNNYYGPVYLSNKDVVIKLIKANDQIYDEDSPRGFKIYKPYSYEYTDTVSPGGSFKITFNLYDSEEEAAKPNGTLSANSWGYGQTYFSISTIGKEDFPYIDGFPINGGTHTYSASPWSDVFKLNDKTVSMYRNQIYTFADPKYFVTERSTFGSKTPEDRVLWQYALENYVNAGNGGSLFGIVSLVGTTDSVGIFETASHLTSPYRYAEFNLQDSIHYAIGVDYPNDQLGGTNKASQVNKGIVTTYPFTLGEDLTISPTHPQTYATDLEDSNMAVWYTLAGSDIFTDKMSMKSRSSLFAATPYDGMDNYFLYSYQYGKGTVHYCGAGHSVVTGADKNNNDERMLYINIVVDSVRNSATRPKITVLDKNNKKVTENSKGNLKLDSNGKYVYTLDNISEIPEFNFDVKFSSLSGGLSKVLVFYDLNYDNAGGDYSNKYTDDDNHVLIHEYKGPFAGDDPAQKVKVEKNKINVELRSGLYPFSVTTDADGNTVATGDRLGLNQKKDKNGNEIDYFKNYGNYTYIVIWAQDMNGKTAYERVKIKLLQTLFDLTDNTAIQYPIHQFDDDHIFMDITDKFRFNI